MSFPSLLRVRQTFRGPVVNDIAMIVRQQLDRVGVGEKIEPGQKVAITAGSRGIANIAAIVKGAVDYVKQHKGLPYLVPAMGSHGGATADGQRQVLATYDITEETMGCPIRSSMETVVVCQAPEGFDVHFDRNAFEADHVLVIGRIKPHTDFSGAIQSGLMKMMLIGLGKHRGASIYHQAFSDFSFDQIVRSVSAQVIEKCRIVAGLAIVENGYEQTALIEGVRPNEIERREPELLRRAEEWMARLPFDAIDVLVVDRIGKNISGTGMDTNVVGRKINENAATEGEVPSIKKIVVLGLTEATHGNATGIGVADFTTRHVIDQMDYDATCVNCVTSGRTAVGKLPLYYNTERDAIAAALKTVGLVPPDLARLVHIPNTLHLTEIECSTALIPEIDASPNLEIVGPATAVQWDEGGRLVGSWTG